MPQVEMNPYSAAQGIGTMDPITFPDRRYPTPTPLVDSLWNISRRERRHYEKMRVEQLRARKEWEKGEVQRIKVEEMDRRRREKEAMQVWKRELKWISF